MYVIGIGNVTECNQSYIHLNDDGKQFSIKATEENLRDIFNEAEEQSKIYWKMREILYKEYEKRKEAAERKYHYISDDEIKEAFDKDRKLGLELSWKKDTNNEECMRQYSKVFGFGDAFAFAGDMWEITDKLKRQAKTALLKLKG